jgi:PBSX family phage terminase large subunit
MEKLVEASVGGLQRLYDKLVGHQLGVFHGISRTNGERLKRGEIRTLEASMLYRDVIGIGGYRSGKTHAAILKAWNDLLLYPNNQVVVIRKRHEQLRNTFLKDFKEIGEVISDGRLDLLILDEYHGDGSVEMKILAPGKESQIIFRIEPDGDLPTVRDSFKGYESGLWIFEEFSQLKAVTYSVGLSRLSKIITVDGSKEGAHLPGWKPRSIALSNPTFENHWVAEKAREYEAELAGGGKPLGIVIRSRMEDNPFITAEYIAAEKEKYKNDPVGYEMYIMGLDGVETEGRPVFINDFSAKLHVDSLQVNPMLPIIRGIDWGYNYPACVWMQVDDVGHYNILAEWQGREMQVGTFAQMVLDKSKLWFPNCQRWRTWADPSGFSQTDKGISAVMAREAGLPCQPAGPNNDPKRRIEIMRKALCKNVGTRNKVLLRKESTPLLQLAFRHGYYFRIDKHGEISDHPVKNNKFDNIMDACMYAVEGESRGYSEENYVFGGGTGGGETFAQGPDRLEMT